MVQFVKSEQSIEKLFPKNSNFTFAGKQYRVIISGKPRPKKGECKTDIYIKAIDKNNEEIELKISVKQSNADFLENKISYNRAIEIFGKDMLSIIKASLFNLRIVFEEDCLVYFSSFGRTRAHTMKLGWKFELMNKLNGEKSGLIIMSDEQKMDVFAGINLPKDKRDCKVDDILIKDSGIANYIIIKDKDVLTQKECLDSLISIEEYSKNQDIFFACKALNYRFDENKWDGPRPLAVFVEWYLNENNQLTAKLDFEHPFMKNGNESGENLVNILKELGIKEFDDLKSFLSPDIKVHE